SPKALAQGFSRALGVVVTATVPLCVLLAGLAGPAIELIYGRHWAPAAAALPWLMALGLIRIGSELAYDCLIAIGQRRSLFMVQGLWLVTLIPVLLVGARLNGIVGAAQAHVLVGGGIVVPVFLYALSRGGVGVGLIARACAWPFLGGAVMTAIILGLERPFGDGPFALLALSTIALAGYTLCVLPSRDFLRGVRSGDRPQRGRHRSTAPVGPPNRT
ncbi:lipopolysaccharide biosynthesis protein, partial [Streptomyces sp. NPDC088357]